MSDLHGLAQQRAQLLEALGQLRVQAAAFFSGAYHRVEAVLLHPVSPSGQVFVASYASRAAAEDPDTNRLTSRAFPLDAADLCGLTGKTPPPGVTPTEFRGETDFEKIYNWLAQKPEFEGGKAA